MSEFRVKHEVTKSILFNPNNSSFGVSTLIIFLTNQALPKLLGFLVTPNGLSSLS